MSATAAPAADVAITLFRRRRVITCHFPGSGVLHQEIYSLQECSFFQFRPCQGSSHTPLVAAGGSQRADARPGRRWPGIRDWLKRIGDGHALAAAFDTRINGVAAFTGRASRGIDKLLKAHGYNIVAPPESFLIGQGARCSTARRCVPADGVPRSAPRRATSPSRNAAEPR
jgi:hypothetical protein